MRPSPRWTSLIALRSKFSVEATSSMATTKVTTAKVSMFETTCTSMLSSCKATFMMASETSLRAVLSMANDMRKMVDNGRLVINCRWRRYVYGLTHWPSMYSCHWWRHMNKWNMWSYMVDWCVCSIMNTWNMRTHMDSRDVWSDMNWRSIGPNMDRRCM